MIAYFRPLLYASAWQLGTWLLGLVLALQLRPNLASGVFFGGLVMAVNFSLLRFVAHLYHQHGGLSRSVALLVAFKWTLLLALTTAILHFAAPSGVGMAIGMSTLFAGLLGAALHSKKSPSHRQRKLAQSD